MRSFRLLLSMTLAVYMTGAGRLAFAQDVDTSPFSITLAPLQYANVKGNVGKFEALNWMPNGAVEGGEISFVKDINKDISLNVEGSEFTNDNGTGHLTLKDGDRGFFQIDYDAYRKYYDNTGGVYHDTVSGAPWPTQLSGVKASSPDLQMDVSFLKLEAGLGPISDPYIDVVYEHNSKDGDKSLESWAYSYAGTGGTQYRKIAPSWESMDETSDTVTLKEKKDIFGITIKGDQIAEVDYNHTDEYMQNISNGVAVGGQYTSLNSENEYMDAKLFGSGVRMEKWMFDDKTFVGFGYHYNHTHDTELMQNMGQAVTNGVVQPPSDYSGIQNQSLWNYSRASEDEHVFTGNLNTNLTPNLAFIADGRYEHIGSDGNSTYYSDTTTIGTASSIYNMNMDDNQDNEGEHVELRYSGIAHTSLYAESEMEQGRNLDDESYFNISAAPSGSDFNVDRLNRSQKESWTVGGKIVPNRFFIFTTQVKQHWENNEYDTISLQGTPSDQIFLDQLKINGVEESSTLTWKPYHWLQNSLKYQFFTTDYMPREASEGTGVGEYPISKNHMLTSEFTYDITVEPIDPLLLMISYSHVEDYVKTLETAQGANALPTFNSGDNSWLFSGSYTPIADLTWTNSVCYTISNNYVDFSTGVPYGSNFQELNLTTGLDWTYHKWLKIGPKYEHASYRDNSLAGDGNYSANIFMLDAKFSW